MQLRSFLEHYEMNNDIMSLLNQNPKIKNKLSKILKSKETLSDFLDKNPEIKNQVLNILKTGNFIIHEAKNTKSIFVLALALALGTGLFGIKSAYGLGSQETSHIVASYKIEDAINDNNLDLAKTLLSKLDNKTTKDYYRLKIKHEEATLGHAIWTRKDQLKYDALKIGKTPKHEEAKAKQLKIQQKSSPRIEEVDERLENVFYKSGINLIVIKVDNNSDKDINSIEAKIKIGNKILKQIFKQKIYSSKNGYITFNYRNENKIKKSSVEILEINCNE